MTTHPESPVPAASWQVLRGPLTSEQWRRELRDVAATHHLTLDERTPHHAVLSATGSPGQMVLRWRDTAPVPGDTQVHSPGPEPWLEVLIEADAATPDPAPASDTLISRGCHDLALRLRRHSPHEIDRIVEHMPLLARFTPGGTSALANWALIFRDHYVENTLGFLLAVRRASLPAEWIHALAKGDRTSSRERVHATLLAHGITSGVLDNTAINAPDTHAPELATARERLNTFIDRAHAAGRRVLVIDDGGLIAQGYAHRDAPHPVDAALELTVSGLNRITAAGDLAIPVFNLARSELKTHLGYQEIADSCARRLRALLPAHKTIGRPALLLGFGTLGSRLAAAWRAHGGQVHVVDPDPLARIHAAEAGYPTHASAAEALRHLDPVVVIATTGEHALTADDLRLLPDEVVLAPFATKDFSLLAEPEYADHAVVLPGVGRRYRLPGGHHVTLLGDGRSLNLFEADAIPNQGYDAYRAGTLIVAEALCAQADRLPPGVHTTLVDDLIRASGLYEAYFQTYLSPQRSDPHPQADEPGARVSSLVRPAAVKACIVGYGVAGRLHAQVLAERDTSLIVLDPKHQDLPRNIRGFRHGVEELPEAVSRDIDLWSVCCPTADHLPVLTSILRRDQHARVLLEKPACQGHEIDVLAALLTAHPHARIMLVDQYRHSVLPQRVLDLIGVHEPHQPIDHISVLFTKDRRHDIDNGRFVDRSYGVLGYEWLHMLAVLSQLLPVDAMTAYLAQDPHQAELAATFDQRTFVSALTERALIPVGDRSVRVDLSSTITGSTVILGDTPSAEQITTGGWTRGQRVPDDRHRHIAVHAGHTRCTAHLEPVTTAEGWQLDRHRHRITVTRQGALIRDEIVDDSPLHTAIHHAVETLLGETTPATPDLAALRRIAALAEFLRARQPHEVTRVAC